MITRYDVVSSRWSSHFGEKLVSFTLLGEKCKKTVTKSSKVFNYVTFYMSSIKIVQFLTFFDNF